MTVRTVRFNILAFLLTLVMILPACGSGEEANSSPTLVQAEVQSETGEDATPTPVLLVLATTSILGDIVQNVIGEDAQVEVLLPQGTDPHDFQPSAQDVARLYEADLVVANGLGLEQGMTDVLQSATAEGANVFSVGEMLNPLAFSNPGTSDDDHAEDEGDDDHEGEDGDHAEDGGDDDHEGEGGHDHGGSDPHFWLDPRRVAQAARLIAQQLEGLRNGAGWSERAQAYADRMGELDEEITNVLSAVPVPQRKMVTNHDAFGYFADRYQFSVIGTIIPALDTLAEPSSAQLASLIETITEESVPAIFAETTVPTLLAETVAAEVGNEVKVVALYTGSLGDPGSGAETLEGLLRTNARLIAQALG